MAQGAPAPQEPPQPAADAAVTVGEAAPGGAEAGGAGAAAAGGHTLRRLADVLILWFVGGLLLVYNEVMPSGRARLLVTLAGIVALLAPLLLWRLRWLPQDRAAEVLAFGWGADGTGGVRRAGAPEPPALGAAAPGAVAGAEDSTRR